MSSEGTVVLKPLPGPDSLGPYQGLPEEPHRQVNLFKLLHRHLRGRYVLTISLALAGAVAGGVTGYLLRSPKFRAEGLVRIQPVLPRILYKDEENAIPPMFTSFVNTQASLLQNGRVQSKAMNSAAWRALGRGNDPEDQREFASQLVVKTNRDAPELISVSFSDAQAPAALVAVQEVINAYLDLFGGSESKSVREMTVSTLNERKKTLEKNTRDLDTQIRTACSEFETDDLARLTDYNLTQWFNIDGRVKELEFKLAEQGVDPATFPDQPASDDPPEESAPSMLRTPEQIALIDRTMYGYLLDRDALRRQLDSLHSKGYGAQHQSVINVSSELDALEKIIKERTDNWIEPPAQVANGPVLTDLSPRQLVDRYRRLRQQAEALRTRIDLVNKARLQIESLRRELKTNQDNLDDTNRRLDQIGVESKVQEHIGRIDKILPEAPPSTPNDDPRRKFAAFGLILGGGLPIGIMLLISLIDRRFRYADQADEGCASAPMLGILPDLPGTSEDPEQVAAAVHCIHHIRTRLQLGDSSRKVYAITSPTAGDGKTSLALSLAMSFTSSGAKALVVDFDLVGHALTSRLGVSCDRGIGHHLVFPNGNTLITETSVPRLSLIAAGSDDVRCHSRVPREAFKALIEGLRNQYDVIIIDTGPVLGSLEASIAAVAADGVVLVVGRGQLGNRVRDAMSQLGQLGAHVAGMVFNRAYAMDFSRSSVVSASFRSIRAAGSVRAQPAPQPRPAPPAIDGLDPLARGVAIDIHQSPSTSVNKIDD